MCQLDKAEEAAREVMNSSDQLSDDAQSQKLFDAIVKCLRTDCTPVDAANTFALPIDTVCAAVEAARSLIEPPVQNGLFGTVD